MTLLPENLAEAAPKAVIDSMTRLAAAKTAAEDAAASRREAQAALEIVPVADDAAFAAAIEAGKPNPNLSKPLREDAFEKARKREDVASDLYRKAAAEFTYLLGHHREELVRAQTPLVEGAADDAARTLELLVGQLDRLAREAGVLRGLRNPRTGQSPQSAERRRLLGRAPSVELPNLEPVPVRGSEQIAVLANAIDELTRPPIRERILEAIGDRPTTWDDVAAKLGVRLNDGEACAIRSFLLEDKVIAWCDHDGDPLPSARSQGGLQMVKQYLRRVTDPPLSPTQAARAAVAGRAA